MAKANGSQMSRSLEVKGSEGMCKAAQRAKFYDLLGSPGDLNGFNVNEVKWAVEGSEGVEGERGVGGLIHHCTIFLCSLDFGNIYDQCRGPNIKEKDHQAG